MEKTTLIAIVIVVGAAGCRMAPCGGCADWETCNAATNECVLNSGTRFDLVAVEGSVPGDSWDPLFGPPDPYICASDGQMEQCSSIQADDASPTWNDTLLTGLDGAALLETPLSFDYEDSDLDSPDVICQGGVTLTAAELHDGGFRFDCNNGSYARFRLHNTDRGTPSL
jgi:hypothetical protein